MDLRKLREHSDSEVWQFKKLGKRIKSTPFFIILGIIVLISLTLLYFSWFSPKQKEPIKVFKAIEIPRQQGIASEEKSVPQSTKVSTDTDSSSEMLMNTVPTEDTNTAPIEDTSDKENREKEPESEYSEPSEPGAAPQKDDTNEETYKLVEQFKEEKAEIEQMLREGEQLSAQAQNTLNRAAPILINHLNSLSPEKQREFLNQVRTQMLSQFPPEVRELFDNDPELEKKAWQNFLGLLRTHGFEPPDEN